MDRNEFITRLFDAAAQRAGGAADFACAAAYSAGESFEVEVHEGEILRYEAANACRLRFQVLMNGKMGFASTEILDEAAIDLLVDGAMENAALIESEDRQFLFEGSESYPELQLYSPELDAVTPAQRIEMARELEKMTLAQDARILRVSDCAVFYSSSEVAMVNTRGLNVSTRGNLLGGYVGAVAGEGEGPVNTGFKFFCVTRPGEIDLPAVAREAAAEALGGLGAAPVPSGVTPVLLRRNVAATLLGTFAGIFSAENAQRGLSRLKGREGEVIAADCVTLMDDPHKAGSAASRPFDGEGVATRVKAVVESGRLNTLLHNLKTAYKQGVETTANASEGGVGVAPSNFYFAPGAQDFDALLAAMGEGLLITELQGMHAGANPITGDFSLAAKGFRVREGRMAEPVAQITVAGNFYDLLKDIVAVGSDLEMGAPGGSCMGSPTLWVKRLSVAGE